MKLFVGWAVSAALAMAATAAGAQTLPPGQSGVALASDIGGPYAAMPPDAVPPRYGPAMLPPMEVYTVLRENGFSPLGIPRQRGEVYTIAALDLHNGEDGRLVIDARNGRIVRFVPAYRMGGRMGDDVAVSYGPAGPPPLTDMRRVPRPPLNIPKVASRSVPLPRATPPRAVADPKPVTPVAAVPAPAPAQQSAAAQPAPAATPPAEAKPPVQIQPTQEMPKAQGLD